MANVSKADLVKELTESTGVSSEDVKAVVEDMLTSVGTHLKQGDKVHAAHGFQHVRGQGAQRPHRRQTGDSQKYADYSAILFLSVLEANIASPMAVR